MKKRLLAALVGLGLLATACAGSSGTAAPAPPTTSPATTSSASAGSGSGESSAPAVGNQVILVTHDSFAVDKKVLADFESSSGIKVTVLTQGDAGALVNKLILTKSNPIGDAVFGIDNSFASRAEQAGILAPYTSPAAGPGAQAYARGDLLTPIDYGDVCVNVDHAWFTAKKMAEPRTFEDLAKPAFKNLLVTESAATSSPGLIFLLGSIAHFGPDKWQGYWKSLVDNGVKVTAGWTDAYTVDFSGSSGKGARPLVVSYASSPPAEVHDGTTTTAALLDTCFRQVEYAGVLAGAKHPVAAQKVVDFMLSQPFQAQVAPEMYVYPVKQGVALPADWQKFAPVAPHPLTLDPTLIAANRNKWISAWSDLVQS